MQKITFKVVPYLRGDGTVDPKYTAVQLCIDGIRDCEDSCSTSFWNESEENKDLIRFKLLAKFPFGHLHKDPNVDIYYQPETHYYMDEDLYQRWYEYEFMIHGEDAYTFVTRVPRTRHSVHFQAMMGVEAGWKYYKKLRDAEFREEVAAHLAYWRGYLAGMDLNNPWDREGTEAIRCMDLELEAGRKFAYDED